MFHLVSIKSTSSWHFAHHNYVPVYEAASALVPPVPSVSILSRKLYDRDILSTFYYKVKGNNACFQNVTCITWVDYHWDKLLTHEMYHLWAYIWFYSYSKVNEKLYLYQNTQQVLDANKSTWDTLQVIFFWWCLSKHLSCWKYFHVCCNVTVVSMNVLAFSGAACRKPSSLTCCRYYSDSLIDHWCVVLVLPKESIDV